MKFMGMCLDVKQESDGLKVVVFRERRRVSEGARQRDTHTYNTTQQDCDADERRDGKKLRKVQCRCELELERETDPMGREEESKNKKLVGTRKAGCNLNTSSLSPSSLPLSY